MKIRHVSLHLLLLSLLLPLAASVSAGSATWRPDAISNDWNTAANWTPATVPNGPEDIATFGVSDVTSLTLSAPTVVHSLVFNPGASAFTFTAGSSLHSDSTPTLDFVGDGIVNNSNVTQQFITPATGISSGDLELRFSNHASAGTNTTFICNTGTIRFSGASTAASATLIANGATVQTGTIVGVIAFADESSAGQAMIGVNPGTASFTSGGTLSVNDDATLADATVTLKGASVASGGGGHASLSGGTAGNAVITTVPAINQGGDASISAIADFGHATVTANDSPDGSSGVQIQLNKGADATNARFVILGTSHLEVSDKANLHMGMSVGSVEGDGTVYLGRRRLLLGGNNLSTIFSGTINGGTLSGGDTTGSIEKIGNGTLIMTGTGNYTGGTTLDEGAILIGSRSGSATGTGPVQVNGGNLGGMGNISGTVTIGSGNGSGSTLAPGVRGPGALAINAPLTFKADSTYRCELSTVKAKADEVTATAISIESGARFAFVVRGGQTLAPGTVFTIINNTSASPISGAFANAADGLLFTAKGIRFEVSYEGGDGNDMTLTVVP
jgi:autotransporter-associated beta strand protein